MLQCVSEGHQIVALANLRPQNKGESSYIDTEVLECSGPVSIPTRATK